ncbi:hypothetical protein [Lysobacter auxotrophicus]|uniref:Uncharacterized protein n=1 Tax=Lysobacter auxotrophicus TaxID=2992573 RepID=A0ABN6UJL7_9GAMM|nr:hypothetical protein [Lysobacter auxotrophicus]BDU16520.1 hypothetical protein LA521A_17210 [Lysobacter auxotrophicus]
MDRNTEEAMCSLQALVHVQGLALRALAATHPDASALLAAWRSVLADAETGPVSVRERNSAYLAELCRIHAEDWTAELVDLALPRLDADRSAVADDSVVPMRRPQE